MEKLQTEKQEKNPHMPEKKEILGNIETSFRALLCGCSGQGKSTLIRNMLMDPSYNLVDKKFKADCVFIFTPTLDLDDSWIDIVKFLESKSTPEHEFKRNQQCFTQNLEQALSTVYEDIIAQNKSKKQDKTTLDHYLIIIDDSVLELSMGNTSLIAKILCKIRHYQTSIILSVQYLRSVGTIARQQINIFIGFSTNSSLEIIKIFQECGGSISKKDFINIYSFAVEKPHSFIWIMMQYPTKYRFFRGIGTELQQLSV